MSEPISAQALFKAGLTKEQFLEKYSELQKSNGDKDSSIFTDDFANSLEVIFDTLNANGNDTLDAEEITTLQGMGDKDNSTLSEADLKALYTRMGKEIMGKYPENSSPQQMYNNAMANSDAQSNTYFQDLNQQISTLQELISLRQINSTNIQLSLQSQIDEIIKKDTTLTTEQKTEYIQLSNELATLQKEADKNAVEMNKIEEQMRNNENEIKLTQAEIDKMSANSEENADGLDTWKKDLSRLNAQKINLTFEYSNLSEKQKSYTTKISAKKSELEKKSQEITAGNPILKIKIEMFRNQIEQEKASSEKEIQGYRAHITNLQNAQNYTIEQMRNQPSQTEASGEASHQNDNLMSFDSLKAMGLEYSSANGQKLAGTIQKHLKGFTGYCSRHVSNALAESGLGTERCGSAADMDSKLVNNKNFKEIKVGSADDLKRLPAGCILVYERGAARYNAKHGHIEVTLGDGTAGSDGRTRNLRYTENMHVFVPVQQAA